MSDQGFRLRLGQCIDEAAGGKWMVFARKAGIPKNTFQRYVDQRRPATPRLGHLRRIARAANKTVEWLVDGTEPLVIREPPAHRYGAATEDDVHQLAEHARRAFADLLERVGPDDRAEIVGHLKGQITLLARLAAALAQPVEEGARKKAARESLRRKTGT